MSTVRSALHRAPRFVPMGLLIALLAVLVVMPLAMLVYASVIDVVPRPGATAGSFTFEWYRGLLNPANYEAARNSVVTAGGGTVIALTFGGVLAWLAARTDVPGKAMVQFSGIIPLFTSSLVGALAWSRLASPRSGYLNIILDSLGIPITLNVYSYAGIMFVFGIYYAPYAFLLVYSALSLMNPELEEAARVHGGSQWATARTVTFPLVAPAILAATLLTFALTIENFPVPTLLGTPARIVTLPSFIYRLMNAAPPRANEAATIGVLLLVLLAALIFLQRRLLASREYTTVTGKGFRPRTIPLGRWRWVGFSFATLYILLAVVLPFLALVQTAARQQPFVADAAALFDPAAFGRRNFVETLDYHPFRIGLKNSIITAVLAAVIGTVLHFTMAFLSQRSKAPGRRLIDYLAVAPVSVPAIVLGLGFLWTYYALPIPLYGTLAVLVIAYIVRFMPQGFSSMSSSLRQVHKDLEESAQVAGASKLRSSVEITIPLIRSSVVSALLLLLILSMRELSAALFLFTADTRVLSIVIYDFWESGVVARAAVASLVYSAILALVTMVGRRWLGVRSA